MGIAAIRAAISSTATGLGIPRDIVYKYTATVAAGHATEADTYLREQGYAKHAAVLGECVAQHQAALLQHHASDGAQGAG